MEAVNVTEHIYSRFLKMGWRRLLLNSPERYQVHFGIVVLAIPNNNSLDATQVWGPQKLHSRTW